MTAADTLIRVKDLKVHFPVRKGLLKRQVGAIRAGRYIAHRYAEDPPPLDEFGSAAGDQIVEYLEFCRRVCGQAAGDGSITPTAVLTEIQERMSSCAAHVREPAAVAVAVGDAWTLHHRVGDRLRVTETRKLPLAFRAVDLCLTHAVYLEAIAGYFDAGGRSRGSVMVRDAGGEPVRAGLEDHWRVARHESDAKVERQVLEVRYRNADDVEKTWVDVRPIPVGSGWFEQVWAEYRAGETFTAPEEG